MVLFSRSHVLHFLVCVFFFFQAEDGIRDLVRSRGLGDVYKRQGISCKSTEEFKESNSFLSILKTLADHISGDAPLPLSLIHI